MAAMLRNGLLAGVFFLKCSGGAPLDLLLPNMFDASVDAEPLPTDPLLFFDVCQMVKAHGYPCEKHEVLTSDGYQLGLQRIPHGHNMSSAPRDRPVAFLQHGLLGSASNWVENFPHQSLGYVLADNGFDVWLGNVRGNTYSRKHKEYTPDTRVFWDFSWDEHALKDLPAMVEYALATSGQKKLHYVGHSQGTTIAFAGTSKNETLGNMMHAIYALAPVARPLSVKGLCKAMGNYLTEEMLDRLLDSGTIGVGEVLPSRSEIANSTVELCQAQPKDCAEILYQFVGPDNNHFNVSRMPVYLSNNPAGTSLNNARHWGQAFKLGKFQMLDFGPDINKKRYGQTTPPQYKLQDVKVPVAMFSGVNDFLAPPVDVAWLRTQLGDRVFYEKTVPDWEHMDFIWGMDAPSVIYATLLDLMRSRWQS